ncbi:MAG: GNAT family N-acetyltransferase [Deltaproteobacteria bacterium]|nr:GNAT family N-acetyltransferase [Deltaproteobacteria bacterium]
MTDAAAAFSDSYAAARAACLAAAASAGGELRSYRHPLPGPDGAPLFLDTARFGAPDARRVVFVASGTHGVEGFCGSGIQTYLLRDGLAGRLPDGVALVLIHAANPWGFAWGRRVNEDNVDLNRNFLDHAAPHPENPDYDRLDAVLNPAALEPEDIGAFVAAVADFQREHGPEAVYRALSGGQYRHPRGLQYGGVTPVWSNRVLREVWAAHAGRAELAVYIDLHSGLGPRGLGLVLQTARDESIDARLSHAWWPDVVRVSPDGGADALLVSGLMGPAFSAQAPAAAVGVVLEFGTLPMHEVMLAVQADNWLHHHGARDSARGRAIAQQMRDAFFLTDADWQETVCARAREVLAGALAGMAAFTPEAAADGAVVRAALPGDREVLVEFAAAMAQETEDKGLDRATLRAGVDAMLADAARARVFVVEAEGAVVASLMLTLEWSEWRNGWFWWIQSVYVRPGHRRRGFYRRLHEHVRRLAARQPEVCGLRLYVEQENHHAQHTYRALGMFETAYRLYEQPTRRSTGG